MKLYIEVIVIFAILGLVILWFAWDALSKWIATKRYKPENDKGRKTSEKGGEIEPNTIGESDIAGEQPVEAAVVNSPGLDKPSGPELLPQAEVSPDGETSDGNRKDGNGIRKLLRRSRKG